MIQHLTPEELDFCETLYDPIALCECLFNNFENMVVMDEEEFGNIRLGQLPLMSYEYLIDTENPELTEKQNFKLREGAGNVWALGGRLFGKTMCVEKLDIICSMILLDGDTEGFTSYDAIHIRGVLEDIIRVVELHPFVSLFKGRIVRSPSYNITMKNGFKLEGVNMNLQSKDPGSQFFQKHFRKLFIEEASFEPEVVNKKRLDSVSEDGCVIRSAGMTNFTKYSPCGRIFYDLSKKAWLCNLPQYVNPKWDSLTKEHALKEHGGENSLTYRIFVKGEIVEDGIAVFDMERVRKCYREKKHVKHIEITKENFGNFENFIIVDRPKGTDYLYVCADIGESAPSEIIIVAEIDKMLHYLYNITLYNLTDKQQFKIFKYLGKTLKANYIGLDTTDGTGRSIYRSLAEVFPHENLVWVAFNEKIEIGFKKDDDDNIIIENKKPVIEEEFVVTWSVKRLRDLLYSQRISIPLDYRFDRQFNSVISVQSGIKTLYACATSENHLFQAFQVFGIAQWQCEFANSKPINKKQHAKSGC